MKKSLLVTGYILIWFCHSSVAQVADDSNVGVYYKSSSTSLRTDWFQVMDNGDGNFEITDIFGVGFQSNLNDGLAHAIGSDKISVPPLNGQEAYTLDRVVGTTANFPQTISEPKLPNPLLAGDWNIEELLLHPVSGEILPQFDGSLVFIDVFTLSIAGSSVRFADSAGTYFQGVLTTATEGAFRLIQNPLKTIPTTGPYASNSGSGANFARDILGSMKFTDINHFEVTLLLQDYKAVNPQQFMLSISGERASPLPIGDVNGDRLVDALDLQSLQQQIGLVESDATFNLAADLDGNQVIDQRDLALFNHQGVETKSVIPAMSGLWYDPAHDGEGWDIQILSDSSAFVTWYTYDKTGRQVWLVGSGHIVGNEIWVPEFRVATEGTVFGPTFNPADILLAHWGSALFHFAGCDTGGMSWSGPDGFGNGGLSTVRLTNLAGLDCDEVSNTSNQASAFSGIWYDPSQDGQGWLIEGLENNNAVITWYTYDNNGELMWLIGNATVSGNVLTADDLLLPSGGQFGEHYDPDDIVRTRWGRLQMTLSDCESGALTYESELVEFGSGHLSPIRLGRVHGLECELGTQ